MAKLSQKPETYLEQNKYKTRSETVQELFERWQFTPDKEKVPLNMAAGRISALDVFSLNTLPICRAAAADGVAVRYSDFEKGLPDFSNWTENVDYASADMGMILMMLLTRFFG